MKKLIITILISLFYFSVTFGQRLIPQVDKRVEIMSIITRLAGYEEYNQNNAKQYVTDIHSHFDKFNNDTLISLLKELRAQDNGLGFDGVMSMAVNLKQQNDIFSLKKGWQQNLDKRWSIKSAEQFVILLNSFYQNSEANVFFENEKTYYNKILTAFDKVLKTFNQKWYFNYYGVNPKDKFNIIIGCGNGGGNYGPSTNSPEDGKQIYAIMGSWTFDNNNNPVFKEKDYLPTLIHEFNHSFINPLLEKYKKDKSFKHYGQTLLDSMRTEMANQAYRDWEAVINESLVRASVVRYIIENGGSNEEAKNEIMTQHNRGFLWTEKLVSLLEKYEKNRTQYKNLGEFYPSIIEFFKKTSENISAIKANHEANIPLVTSIEPFNNNSQDVDTSLTEMTINFSQPMNGKGHSFNHGKLGQEGFPIKSIIGYCNNNSSFKLQLDLKPNTEYEMVVTGLAFKNTEGYSLKNYLIKFKTKP